jgi:hypothetical protein
MFDRVLRFGFATINRKGNALFDPVFVTTNVTFTFLYGSLFVTVTDIEVTISDGKLKGTYQSGCNRPLPIGSSRGVRVPRKGGDHEGRPSSVICMRGEG